MKTSTEFDRLFRIMYHPVAYTHPDYLTEPQLTEHMCDDRLINFWLFARYQLEDLPEGWFPGCPTTSLILAYWQRLPVVAHLVGGYLLRSQLMKRCALLATDARLRAFISLPLVHQINIPDSADITTTDCGAAFVNSISAGLPHALRQRLTLCFPAPETQALCEVVPTPDHINLLKMAITYANN